MKAFTLLLLLPMPVLAQATLLVGPGQPHANIQSAIDAASPGDRVLVTAGTYAPFQLQKGITLRAEPVGAIVVVAGSPQSVHCAIPQGAAATIEGLTVQTRMLVQGAGSSASGPLALNRVRTTASIVVDGANLALGRCEVRGLGPCLDLIGSCTVSVTQTTMVGALGGFVASNEAIRSAGQAQILVSNSTLTGGMVGLHFWQAASPAVRLSGNDRAWFVDCTLSAFQQAQFACLAAVNQSAVPLVHERCTFADHTGQPQAYSGPQQNGLVLALSMSTPLTRGGTAQLEFRSRPGRLIVAHAAFGLSTPVQYPFAAQPDWGFVGSSLQLVLLVADGDGFGRVPVTLPNAPWVQDLPLWFSGWSESGLPVQLAPVCGGLVR